MLMARVSSHPKLASWTLSPMPLIGIYYPGMAGSKPASLAHSLAKNVHEWGLSAIRSDPKSTSALEVQDLMKSPIKLLGI